MIKVDQATLDEMEKLYPGIIGSILQFENAQYPACSHCSSEDTASVQVGIIGRTIHIASAMTKFKLIMNGPKPGKYFCNACREFFAESQT